MDRSAAAIGVPTKSRESPLPPPPFLSIRLALLLLRIRPPPVRSITIRYDSVMTCKSIARRQMKLPGKNFRLRSRCEDSPLPKCAVQYTTGDNWVVCPILPAPLPSHALHCPLLFRCQSSDIGEHLHFKLLRGIMCRYFGVFVAVLTSPFFSNIYRIPVLYVCYLLAM